MTDKTRTYRHCGSKFVFIVGDKEFYKEKGFHNEPTRWVHCRRARNQ